jgi:hypothetical protein
MGKKKRKNVKKPAVLKTERAAKGKLNAAPAKLSLKLIGILFFLTIVPVLSFFNYQSLKNFFTTFTSDENSNNRIELIGRPPFPIVELKNEPRKTQFEDFAGSESCKECHEREYNIWINSTHGKAGGEPEKVRIIARFDGNPLYFRDAVVAPTISGQGEYLFVVNQIGRPERIIRVDAVVGGGHMYGGGTQSFFSKFPDGTLRFLPFDFIREENTWFVQLKEGSVWTNITREIALDDLLQWEPHRMLGSQEGSSNCQNCHGSQILLEYNPATRRYRTRYSTLQINCESCHGPSERHNKLSELENHKELEDLDMEVLAIFTKDQSINVCYQCHATKDILQDKYLQGDNKEDYYSLRLPILGSEPYLPDGRIRSFGYQQGHSFSDCYVSGSMTCVDCHDPHSQTYRDVFWKPLAGKFDNGQCTGCHASKTKTPELHSHHKADSTGNLCTGCHMPFLQHQGLGHDLVFARSDHVIPIPRPIFDTSIGIEDACTKCHRDKSVQWLQEKTDEWYGTLKPHNPVIRAVLQSENENNIFSAADALLQTESNHTIGQITALTIFIKRFLKPDMPSLDHKIVEKFMKMSRSDDVDLKALALMSLHLSRGNDPAIRSYLMQTLQNLRQRENAVRRRWSLSIDFMGNLYASEGNLDYAILAHKKALEINPDDGFTWINLGNALRANKRYLDAIHAFQESLKIKPYMIFIHFQLAELYNITSRRREAIQTLKQLLRLEPENQIARRMLSQLERS